MSAGLLRTGASGLALACLLAACATPQRPADVPGWSGRMALQVDGEASRSFSAAFELRGAPQAGELTLFTPLGGTAGRITWSPGKAVLDLNGQARQFDSLAMLGSEATGAPIPVAALFDWLAGTNTPVNGWQADLSRAAEGRIHARRTSPLPVADLRIVLER